MKHVIFLILFFATYSMYGKGFNIRVNLPNAADKKVLLAYYYIQNIFVKDTIKLDSKGSGFLKSDTLLPQGLYKIYLDDKNHFDFLMGADQEFTLSNDSFDTKNLKVEGAPETEELGKYLLYLIDIQTRDKEWKAMLEKAEGEEKKKIEEEIGRLTPMLQEYWLGINQKYPKSMLATFLMANYMPSLDVSALPVEVQKNDSLLLLARFQYQKQHYWDYFDVSDERLYYTPLLKPKLETWFTKVLVQQYDSAKSYVIDLIEKTRLNKRNFQFVLSFFINATVNSNILGMDALFVDLAQKYYLSGEATWATKESLDKIRENVMFLQNNLIGKTGANLILENIDGEKVNLYEIHSKYTVVLIYEPNCSHCKVFVPEFHKEVYIPYRDKGLEVFAIYSLDKKEEWIDFITKNNLTDWINVWDKTHFSRFKVLYDARVTPGVYVLDRNKKIVAKRLTVEQLKRFMEKELN